jgi:CRISPR/Cas system CSM-associated protein Csm2 small subunit
MKINREQHAFLSKEDFEAFLDQLKPLEVDALLEAIEDKELPLTMLNKLRLDAKTALMEAAESVKEIENELTRIRSQVDKWNGKKPKSSESLQPAQVNGNGSPN